MIKIAIIGLGYVGLPLALAFATKYETIGFDINRSRIDELKKGIDSTREVNREELSSSSLAFTTDLNEIKPANVYIVTVPTPIDVNNQPDMTPLVKSSQMISNLICKDDLVIYESTVYPGATEEVCVPILEESGFTYNIDFGVGYSPERINPGDKDHRVENILKVTSGSNDKFAEIVDDLYNSVIKAGTYKASSIKVAEAAKVIENTQRDVNIALVNELALIFNEVGIDTHEVLEAAGTKWNFIPFKPGLVGGHCIGVDPYYLAHKASALGISPQLILTSRAINNSMSKFIAEQTIKQLILNDKNIKDANVLILGVTFKENCPDVRNTKVLEVGNELIKYGLNINYCDPWVIDEDWDKLAIKALSFSEIKKTNQVFDAVIIAVNHDEFIEQSDEINKLCGNTPVLIDVKGVLNTPTNWRL